MSKIDELRQACQALYLEVPAPIADEIKAKAEAVIAELEKEQFFIQCLESGGVDNWVWYSDSLEDYWNRYP